MAVANIAQWHGYDRLIRGMANYIKTNNNTKVIFNIVGEGHAKTKLKDYVEEKSLGDVVIFHGYKTGQDIDTMFNKCDIAVDVLGMHRRGYNECNSIKAREYCARGIPFVTSGDDPDFPNNYSWRLKLPADESSIKIEEVVEFYDKISKTDYRNEMRNFAEKNLTWEVKLKPVVEYIKKNK